MADDLAMLIDDQRLRNCAPAIHQGARRRRIGPADTKTEVHIAHELLNPVACRERVFGGQRDELHLAPGVFFSHFLVIRDLSPARATPRGPNIYHHYLSVKVSQPKTAVVDGL